MKGPRSTDKDTRRRVSETVHRIRGLEVNTNKGPEFVPDVQKIDV